MASKTQPFSVRLSRDADALVRHEMRRTGRSRSVVVEELAEEAAKARLFPGIAFRGPEPRRAWLIGTGLDVWEIVELHRDYGADGARLAEDHPALDERSLRLALAYAERFPEEVAERLDANRRPTEELLALYPFLRAETTEP
jgi:uncharacterized protein (DUF433 family)